MFNDKIQSNNSSQSYVWSLMPLFRLYLWTYTFSNYSWNFKWKHAAVIWWEEVFVIKHGLLQLIIYFLWIHIPIKFECYFWLICIKIMCSDACYGFNVHIVFMQNIFIKHNCLIHIIHALKWYSVLILQNHVLRHYLPWLLDG